MTLGTRTKRHGFELGIETLCTPLWLNSLCWVYVHSKRGPGGRKMPTVMIFQLLMGYGVAERTTKGSIGEGPEVYAGHEYVLEQWHQCFRPARGWPKVS